MTKQDIEQLEKTVADLRIQAMMFDMDIDIETLSLVPKSTYIEEVWITRWKEKRNNSDWTVVDNGF